MTTSENVPQIQFQEVSTDRYRFTAEEAVALGAAWRVLRAFEKNQYGFNRDYEDYSQARTFEYLLDRGEERPLGVFAVSLSKSREVEGMTDVFVSNRNGRGMQVYEDQLRAAIAAAEMGDSSNSED